MSDRLRLVAFSDVHGNPSALDAVLADVEQEGGADVFWVLGDHAALGPEPVEALGTLAALPHATFTRGNTDRYVLTGDLPPPSIGDPVQSAAFFAWTRGVLTAGGWLEWLDAHPLEVRLTLPDGTRVLGVHASPGRDDGLGLRAEQSEDELEELVGGCEADLVLVGHTHMPVDRTHRGVRLVNLGSVSLPMRERPARDLRGRGRGAGRPHGRAPTRRVRLRADRRRGGAGARSLRRPRPRHLRRLGPSPAAARRGRAGRRRSGTGPSRA